MTQTASPAAALAHRRARRAWPAVTLGRRRRNAEGPRDTLQALRGRTLLTACWWMRLLVAFLNGGACGGAEFDNVTRLNYLTFAGGQGFYLGMY